MVKLRQISNILNGDRSSNYPSGNDFKEFGVPFINAGHIANGLVDYSNVDYISREKYRSLSGAKIKRDDILLCLRGSLGKYALIKKNEGAPASSLAVIRPITQKISPQYLLQVISSPIFQNQILEQNNGSSQPNLSASSVADFYIPLPSFEEQQKIAAALSDMDELIASLEKLITKKKAIKQGAMQELLTGKKRLPGFDGEWEIRKLKEILTVKHGSSQHAVEDPNGQYPILATGGLIGWANDFLCETPSVLIGRKGTINKPQYMNTPFWSIDTLFYTNIYENNDAKFIFYLFCKIDWLSYNEASGVPSLSSKAIENIEASIPEYKEQQAIASILSDMDAEIEALELKLAKCRQTKQGMMQQLLTGKIRLV